jgi:hypothetical protein
MELHYYNPTTSVRNSCQKWHYPTVYVVYALHCMYVACKVHVAKSEYHAVVPWQRAAPPCLKNSMAFGRNTYSTCAVNQKTSSHDKYVIITSLMFWDFGKSTYQGMKTNAKGGADAQLGEKQCMWRHLRHERATTSFQMRRSQGMTFPIALSTSPSSPSCVSAPRIGLVPPVPHYYTRPNMHKYNQHWQRKKIKIAKRTLTMSARVCTGYGPISQWEA